MKQGLIKGGEIVLYLAPDGAVQLHVRLERETVSLSLDQMTNLFRRDKSLIPPHFRNAFNARELEREAPVAKNATTHMANQRATGLGRANSWMLGCRRG